jgi:hypothetical protein
LNGGRWKLISEHVEVESGKDDHNRPALQQALEACKIYGATLIIAKIDRLSRDAHFLLGLQKAGVKFIAADMARGQRDGCRHDGAGGTGRAQNDHGLLETPTIASYLSRVDVGGESRLYVRLWADVRQSAALAPSYSHVDIG